MENKNGNIARDNGSLKWENSAKFDSRPIMNFNSWLLGWEGRWFFSFSFVRSESYGHNGADEQKKMVAVYENDGTPWAGTNTHTRARVETWAPFVWIYIRNTICAIQRSVDIFLMHITNDYDDNNNNNTHNINNIIVKDPHISVLFNLTLSERKMVKWLRAANSVQNATCVQFIPFGPGCYPLSMVSFYFANAQYSHSFSTSTPHFPTTLLTVQIVTRFDHFHSHITHSLARSHSHAPKSRQFIHAFKHIFLFGNLIYTLSNKNVATHIHPFALSLCLSFFLTLITLSSVGVKKASLYAREQ